MAIIWFSHITFLKQTLEEKSNHYLCLLFQQLVTSSNVFSIFCPQQHQRLNPFFFSANCAGCTCSWFSGSSSEEKEQSGGLQFVEILDSNSGFAKIFSFRVLTSQIGIYPPLIAWQSFPQNCLRSVWCCRRWQEQKLYRLRANIKQEYISFTSGIHMFAS